jgi:hypothetical protein
MMKMMAIDARIWPQTELGDKGEHDPRIAPAVAAA